MNVCQISERKLPRKEEQIFFEAISRTQKDHSLENITCDKCFKKLTISLEARIKCGCDHLTI